MDAGVVPDELHRGLRHLNQYYSREQCCEMVEMVRTARSSLWLQEQQQQQQQCSSSSNNDKVAPEVLVDIPSSSSASPRRPQNNSAHDLVRTMRFMYYRFGFKGACVPLSRATLGSVP